MIKKFTLNKVMIKENRNPITNNVGKKKVILLYSGYHESKIGLALPNLCTCLENFSQSILRL